jgi:hypothetical protein
MGKKKGVLGLAAFLVLLCLFTSSRAEIREYVLGDTDNFIYNGTGSVDDVYVDAAWQNYWLGFSTPVKKFDVATNDQVIPFTFVYDLADGESVIAATLAIGLRATDVTAPAGYFVIGIVRPSFNTLGWETISATETTICSVDLSNVQGWNAIPTLQGGQLDVAIRRTYAVDYAILTLNVVPEPTTLLLVGFGSIVVRRFYKPASK